jgi:hypothetical protein
VLGPKGDTDASGVQVLGQPVRHLLGQPLLHLGRPREDLDHPCKLRQTQDPFAGEVPDVRNADEGQEMVLAHRVDVETERAEQIGRSLLGRRQVNVSLLVRHLPLSVETPEVGLR